MRAERLETLPAACLLRFELPGVLPIACLLRAGPPEALATACVLLRWSTVNESAARSRVIGQACVSERGGDSWSTVELQKDGVAVLLRLQTAQVHQLTIEGTTAEAMLHVDQLRLVHVPNA